MSANSFAFPPPPPPPPQHLFAQAASGSNNSSRGRGDKKWERGSRGRGRGNNNRGSRGGSYNAGRDTLNAAGYITSSGSQYGGGSYPLPEYSSVQHAQYPADLRSAYSDSPPPYASVAPQPNQQPTYPFHAPTYPNPQPQSASYAYSSAVYNPQAPQQQPYQPHYISTQHSNHRYASLPVAMGPPLRLGFSDQRDMDPGPFPPNHHGRTIADNGQYNSVSAPLYRQGSSYDLQPGRHRSSNQQRRGRGSFPRRGRADAACSFHDSSRKTQVAPAVPSFGNPLPIKPVALQESKKIKKKKRRVNQLGLTPEIEEHLSSSEDEDVDEELKLSSTVSASGISGHDLKFTYKGQTSVLQSSTDIASWIEERRKRFPTVARKAENDAHLQKLKEEREASKAKKLLERQMKTLEKDKQAAEQAAVEKSKLKVQKLRRKLEKEERRAAKAEAKSLKRNAPHEADELDTHEAKKKRYPSSPKANSVEDRCQEAAKTEPTDFLDRGKVVNVSIAAGPASKLENSHASNGSQTALESAKEEKQEPPSSIPDPLTPTSQPAVPDTDDKPHPQSESITIDVSAVEHKQLENPASDSHGAPDACAMTRQEGLDSATSASSSDTAVHSDESLDDDNDDETSSSGSSSSETKSDSEGPETVTSRGARPQRVLPPKKSKNQDKAICRDFLRSGRCRRGKRCRWRHALPDRGQRKAEKSVLARPERKSLHQRLVEQEEEKARAEGEASNQQEHDTTKDTQVMAV